MKLEEFKEKARWTGMSKLSDGRKLAINPRNGKPATTRDVAGTTGTYDQVETAMRVFRLDGRNVVLTPELGVVAIDIDGAIGDDGSIWHIAGRLVEQFGSYTEISAGKRGLHIFVEGRLDGGRDRLVTPDGKLYDGAATREEAKELGLRHIEIYGGPRWMGVTWNRLPGAPAEILPNQEGVDKLASWLLGVPVVDGVIKRRKPRETITLGSLPPDAEEVRDALRHIPPVLPYSDWFKVVAGVHDGFPNSTGIDILLEWCGNSFKENEDPRKILEYKFRGLGRSSKRLTLLAVLFEAERRGWDRKGWYKRRMEAQSGHPVKFSRLSGAKLTEEQARTEVEELDRMMRDAYMRGFVDGLSAASRTKMEAALPPSVLAVSDTIGIGWDTDTGAVTVPMSVPYEGWLNVEFRLPGGREYQKARGCFVGCSPNAGGACLVVPDTLTAISAWTVYGGTQLPGGGRPSIFGLSEIVDDPLVEWLEDNRAVLVKFGPMRCNWSDRVNGIRVLQLPYATPEEAHSYGLTEELFSQAVAHARVL